MGTIGDHRARRKPPLLVAANERGEDADRGDGGRDHERSPETREKRLLQRADVRAGEPAGRIHCTWDPTRPAETLHYQADGILFGRRQQGRVRPGNCCLVVAAPYGREL